MSLKPQITTFQGAEVAYTPLDQTMGPKVYTNSRLAGSKQITHQDLNFILPKDARG